jgi:hypothetical protein
MAVFFMAVDYLSETLRTPSDRPNSRCCLREKKKSPSGGLPDRDCEVLSQVNMGRHPSSIQDEQSDRSNPQSWGMWTAQCDACVMMALGLLSLRCDAACAW